jgi:hypothetical protein
MPSGIQETSTHPWMQSLKINQSEEVNRLEFAIDCRRAADLCPNCEVGT